MYGDIQGTLGEKETKVLNLPPNYGLLNKVNADTCLIDCEVAINKLRWRRHFPDNTEEQSFYDIDEKSIDIKRMKATSLPFNPRVNMPGVISREEELKCAGFKEDVYKIAKEMEAKQVKYSNVDNDVKEGLESLKEKVRDNTIVCFQTDKSGRWACDDINNYKTACSKHLDNEDITQISMKEHNGAEKEVNCHTLALLRMLGNEADRLRNALVSEGNVIAPLYILRKDHKECEDPVAGPKTRPVCGAKDCLTRRNSFMLCQILQELLPLEERHCDSTEDLLAEFEVANQREIKTNYVVGSLDVEALYPSLDVPLCSKIIGEVLYESGIEIKNMQIKEIVLYLRYNDSESITDELRKYLPTRVTRLGRPPIFTCSGSELKEEDRYKPWIFPDAPTDSMVVRKLFCIAIEVMVRKVMSLHDFQFNQQIHRQNKGGSIGLDLTGVVSGIFMCYWDKKLIGILGENNIRLLVYKRYVDDINLIAEDLNRENKDEATTMGIIQQHANRIDKSIRTTIDYSSKYEDKKLPILDLKVWIGQTHNGEIKILHEHYTKDVSTRSVIHAKSAHPMKTKENVLVNEIVRILRNCSSLIEWKDVIPHIEYFMKRMQFSQYSKEIRYKVLCKALEVYDKKIQTCETNGQRFVRSRDIYAERKKTKKVRQKNWFSKDGKHETVMFVEATENSELKNRVEIAARKHRVKVKIMEKSGITMKKVLQRSNPFGNIPCEREKCVCCCNEEVVSNNVHCRTRGCVYFICCAECKDKVKEEKYRGQTGRSIYERMSEHFDLYNKADEKSILWKHALKHHNGEKYPIEIKIDSQCFGQPTRRLITEAVLISKMDCSESMNGKEEWSYYKIPQIDIVRK